MKKKSFCFFIVSYIIVTFFFADEVLAEVTTKCKYKWTSMNASGHEVEKVVVLEASNNSNEFTIVKTNISKFTDFDKKDPIYLNADGTCPKISYYEGVTTFHVVHSSKEQCIKSELVNSGCSNEIYGEKVTDSNESDNSLKEIKQAALVYKSSGLCTYKNSENGPIFNIALNNKNKLKYTCENGCDALDISRNFFLQQNVKAFNIVDGKLVCPTYIYYSCETLPGNLAGTRTQCSIIGRSNKDDQNHTQVTPIPGDYDKDPTQDEPIINPVDKTDCNNIFQNEFGEFLKSIYDLVKFAVPIIILGFAIVDFLKALASQDDNEVKKATNKLVKRLIIGVLIFVIPTILDFVLKIAGIDFGVCALVE